MSLVENMALKNQQSPSGSKIQKIKMDEKEVKNLNKEMARIKEGNKRFKKARNVFTTRN